MSRPLTLRTVDLATLALEDLLECDGIDRSARGVLEWALSTVELLRGGGAVPTRHRRVVYGPGIGGCSCGERPESPALLDALWDHYHAHLALLGLPRTDAPPSLAPDAHTEWPARPLLEGVAG